MIKASGQQNWANSGPDFIMNDIMDEALWAVSKKQTNIVLEEEGRD